MKENFLLSKHSKVYLFPCFCSSADIDVFAHGGSALASAYLLSRLPTLYIGSHPSGLHHCMLPFRTFPQFLCQSAHAKKMYGESVLGGQWPSFYGAVHHNNNR